MIHPKKPLQPLHKRLVHNRKLRITLYITLLLLCLALIGIGITIGIYTHEYFIITALVPLGVLLFVVDLFCAYCYEFYLKNNERLIFYTYPPPPRLHTNHSILTLYDNGSQDEIDCVMLEPPPSYDYLYNNTSL